MGCLVTSQISGVNLCFVCMYVHVWLQSYISYVRVCMSVRLMLLQEQMGVGIKAPPDAYA